MYNHSGVQYDRNAADVSVVLVMLTLPEMIWTEHFYILYIL